MEEGFDINGYGYGVSLITSQSQTLLTYIIICSLFGIFWHIWLTRRMSFVDFSQDENVSTRTSKNLIRFFLPLCSIAIASISLPFLFVLKNPDLKDYLRDAETVQFVKFPWDTLLPTKGWDITILADLCIGVLLYLIFGFIIWIIFKVVKRF